jgi:hypothetical protein
MSEFDLDPIRIEAESLCEEIKRLLASREPDVVGIVLSELVAIFIAGHAPALRKEMLDLHVGLVREIVPIMIETMIEGGKCGPDWREEKVNGNR